MEELAMATKNKKLETVRVKLPSNCVQVRDVMYNGVLHSDWAETFGALSVRGISKGSELLVDIRLVCRA
jgi:hypothetical protein